MTITQHTPQTPMPAGNDATVRAYENWREKFVRPMLVGALGFGLVALILGLATNQGVVQNAVFIVAYLLIMAVTFLPVPYWARIGVFLLAIYGLSLSELLSLGILGDSIF